MGMKAPKDKIRKKKAKTAIEKVNAGQGKKVQKFGGVNSKFIAEVDTFVEKYQAALKRLAKK